jgi:uncharacterized protein (TIGR04141 family)
VVDKDPEDKVLTCYLLRERVGGVPLERFDQALDLEDLGPRQVQPHDVVTGPNFEAQLFTVSTPDHEVDWVEFLRQGWPELSLPKVASAGAVLCVAVKRRGKPIRLAFTFGTGRYLLREGVQEPGFGIRTALNVIYEGGIDRDPSRLRALDAKKVALNTLRTRYQASQSTSLEIFDVDIMRDILSGITGNPANEDVWGSRVDGRESLGIHGPVEFNDLGDLVNHIVDAYNKEDYRDGFAWIDNVRFVQDDRLRTELSDAVLGHLRADEIDSVELVIPEVIEWARVDAFRYSFDKGFTRPDISLSHYLNHLSAKGKLSSVDVAKLKRDRVLALDDSGNELYRWSVWRCLAAQLDEAGSTYILDGGDFYEVAQDFLEELNSFLDSVSSGPYDFLSPLLGEKERDYLQRTTELSSTFLLLDQRLVHLGSRTSPVEICDLLSLDGLLIHAKKGRGSSELSHLFSQGLVSAELLVASPEFRDKVHQVVAEAVAERPAGSPPWTQELGAGAFASADHPIVYLVIRPKGSTSLRERLRFFSKVNLRRSISDLTRMGYEVSCRVITEPER